MPDRASARKLAHTLLEPLGNRWRHTQGVALRAEQIAPAVAEPDRELLIVAAWCHDLGYAPQLRNTGAHPIDGARFLTRAGYSERLCALVAHHSAAELEANERGLSVELADWPREESAVADALWAADMTTSPTGEPVEYPTRLAEILQRYEPDSPVATAMSKARPVIEAAISRTYQRLYDAQLGPMR
jgi:hypothetical protein